MEYSTWLMQILLFLVICFFYYKRKFSYWARRGIRGPVGWPFVGNMLEQLNKGQLACELEWMEAYGTVYGTYGGHDPSLTIIDADLIKQVLIKDFNLFVNRRKNRSDHEIWGKNLFGIEGDDWKRIRTITSPTFTSGKLRGMVSLMNRCVDKLTATFEKICDRNGTFDVKEVIAGFTIDVIATTSFGTETNSNADGRNVFWDNGKQLFSFSVLRSIALSNLPKTIRKWINLDLNFDKASFKFFADLSKQVVGDRKNSGGKRNDLVQLLIDARVSESELNESYEKLTATADHDDHDAKHQNTKFGKSLTDNEIIAQCILFFIAGFETTASTITHCIFELSQNPEAQDRLLKELHILDGLTENSDKYHDLVMTSIPYLDAVIKETLRMYPPVVRLSRRVNIEGYKLGGIELFKDQVVEIPTFAVHRCKDYYPEPTKFLPDRFMPENKHLLVPYTYLPFGAGPRNCIGMRFAYQEIKLCLSAVVRKFKFTPTSQTPAKLEFSKLGIMSVNPFVLKVDRR